MANKIDLHAIVDRVALLVGKKEVRGLLEQYESILDGFTEKQRKKVVRTLTICDERDIDGG